MNPERSYNGIPAGEMKLFPEGIKRDVDLMTCISHFRQGFFSIFYYE